MPSAEITRCEEFAAAHRLYDPSLTDEENARRFGMCSNPGGHGHNFELEVTVRGEVHEATGMVMNLLDLERIVRERVIDSLDHKNLNRDVPFLRGIIPTAENLAIAIWERIAPELGAFEGCRLHRIRLYESRNNRVDYRGPES
jgi:6-pyruvoyltetrahydropterin/6-carboxytetrahydropterin synthase